MTKFARALLALFLAAAIPAHAIDGRNIDQGTLIDKSLATTTKPWVDLIATTNLTLTGEQTIDGVLTSGSTVLNVGQTTGSQNGPWVTGSGAWTRPAWYATGNLLQAFKGVEVCATQGTARGRACYRLTTSGTITIGTTATTWSISQVAMSSTTATGISNVGYSGVASDLTGTGNCAQQPARTGDVTSSSGSCAQSIATNAVTNGQMATMTQSTFKGRASGAGTGSPQDLTAAQLKTAAAIACSDLTNASASCSTDATNATNIVSGTLPAARLPSFGSGDVSFAAAGGAGTIAASAVTNAKLANLANGRFKCRTTAGTGDPEDCTSAQATALLAAVIGDSGSGGTAGLVPAPGAGSAAAGKFLKADGTFAVPTLAGGATIDVQAFTASGTWTKPALTAARTFVYLIGPSGGSASGSRRAAGNTTGGGGGSASGSYTNFETRTSLLPSTVSVTVGTAGTAGAAITVDSTTGNNGTAASGATSFGGFATAPAGGPGTVSATTGSGGSAGGVGTLQTGLTGTTLNGFGGGNDGATANDGTGNTPGGGGGGGGITAGNVAANGGNGGGSTLPSWTGGLGGTSGASGSSSANQGASDGKGAEGGAGGGGGGAATAATSGSGAIGGRFGAGSGGGGGSRNGFNSGAGANGVNGVALVITIGQ